MLVTTYQYDDPDHPERVTSSVATPEWTEDDRAALMGLQMYEGTLCSGCGVEQRIAWHSESDGWFEGRRWVCHACSAIKGEQVVIAGLAKGPAEEKVAKFPPFDVLATTSPPKEPTSKEQ